MLAKFRHASRITVLAAALAAIAAVPATQAAAGEGDRPGSRPDRSERIERYHEQVRQRQLERAARPERDHDAERAERGWRLIAARLMRDIELTDEQAEQVDAAFAAHRRAVDAWHAEQRDEIRRIAGRMRALHHEGDPQEGLEALRNEARELMEQRPGLDDLGDRLEPLLTEAQREQFEQNHKAVVRAITERLERGRGEATGGRRMPHDVGDWLELPFFEGIELTDEQRERMRELLEARRDAHAAHRDALRELRQQMREAREADDIDKLRSLRRELRELREDRPATPDLREGFREILDDEQWERYRANERAARERWRQRREERQDERDAS